MRGTLHSPQRYFEGHLKTFGGGSGNSVRSGTAEHVSDEFDGLTHHIGEACSKAWLFKRLPVSCPSCPGWIQMAMETEALPVGLRFSIKISPHNTDVCDRPNPPLRVVRCSDMSGVECGVCSRRV